MPQLYDLHIGRTGWQNNSVDGCVMEDSASCGSVENPSSLTCGVNGTCIGSLRIGDEPARCVCKPGWRGTKCNIRE